jgi:hypothetical protein
MAKNLAALQKALEREPAGSPVSRPATAVSPTSYKAPSREGKTNITAYLPLDYKANLRLIQARTNKSLQALLAEALNDLFGKYDVPVIRED